MQGGRDGLTAVTVTDMIGRDLDDRRQLRGFFSLGWARDLSILAAPDIVGRRNPPPEYGMADPADPCVPCYVDRPTATRPRPPIGEQPPRFSLAEIARMQGALIEICETKADRIALLDPPWETASGSPLGLAPIADWRRRFETSYAALVFPWCVVPDPMMRAATRAVPPCGHVAGRIAAEDNARGVPGTGANAPIDWITDTSIVIDRAAHGRLNETGINALCVTHGRAPRLMGARMLSSVSAWRFVTTRRIVCAIRRQLVAALQWAVFAPNDAVTRIMIVRQACDYLEMLRRRGALAGAVPEEAYYARCDDTTTTQSDRDNGRLITEIGIVPSRAVRNHRAQAWKIRRPVRDRRSGHRPAAAVLGGRAMTKRRDPLMSFNFTVSLLPSPDSGNGAAVGTMVLTTSGIRATAGSADSRGAPSRWCRSQSRRG